jgi:hypothetical protein
MLPAQRAAAHARQQVEPLVFFVSLEPTHEGDLQLLCARARARGRFVSRAPAWLASQTLWPARVWVQEGWSGSMVLRLPVGGPNCQRFHIYHTLILDVTGRLRKDQGGNRLVH